MRFARKITLLAVMALAAMALAAGNASATAGDPVEVIDNATAAHCSPQCSVHVVGSEIKLRAHVPFFGELLRYNCGNEYDLNVNEDGSGNISGFAFTNPAEGSPNDCTEIVACETPWPGSATHNEAGTENMIVEACIDTPIVDCEGSFNAPLTETATGINSETANTPIAGTVCEIEPANPASQTNRAHWSDEGDTVTVNHL